MWTMIAVYQDHSFDKPFNIALDIIFWTNYLQVYIGSRGDQSQQRGTAVKSYISFSKRQEFLRNLVVNKFSCELSVA